MKMLKINDSCFVNIDHIVNIVFDNHLQIRTHAEYYTISDGRTLDDVRREIEGEGKVCRWRNSDRGFISPHNHTYLQTRGYLNKYPFCPICGGRIEVING